MTRVRPLLAFLILALLLTQSAVAAEPDKPPAQEKPRKPQQATALPSYPADLPDHFWLGLASQPDRLSWMTGSGIPFDARYQYLAGGANTNNGWAKWNTPDGQFATYYMDASRAAGYLPVFTYYQMLHSAPASGADEAIKDFNNLNNPTTMHAYYADFALLMQKAAAFGDPVLVHVEPDLWGYMERRVSKGSNNAANVTASVASSGYAGLAGLPNTVQGFAWALQYLRSTIAPNVILAIHASAWGDGRDVGIDPDPNLDLAGIVGRMSAFMNSAGMSGNPRGSRSWDLVFVDPSDRDAAYYAQWDGGAHWLDETNQTLPNFNRYREFVSRLSAGTQRRIVLWQVPLGNTKMRSMNNTPGHWQDNRVQYFLGGTAPNLPSWIDAGVIGILFGRGAGDQTDVTDDRGDGITNPAPINGNTGTATVSDDDGGYFRAQAAAYYNRGALPLEPPACGTFSDVPSSYWAYEFIRSLACRNIVSGYSDGRFRPEVTTTRVQLIKMVVLGMGWSTSNPGAQIYSDVRPSDEAYPFVQVATQRGIISGYEDGTFRPNNLITRAQLSKVIVSAKGWGPLTPTTPTFNDVPPSNPFYGFIERAYSRGIISGYGASFRPNNAATRAQISNILYLALETAK